MFPYHRPRRLRKTAAVRDLVRETKVAVEDLVLPVFACEGKGIVAPISSMPGQFRFSSDKLAEHLRRARELGIRAAIVFGVVDESEKNPEGSITWDENGFPAETFRALKAAVPEMILIADLCFCEYTSHGHCGVVTETRGGGRDVDNDATLENLGRQAVTLAGAGADWIAPSGMMDGTVRTVRKALDEHNFSDVTIMMYSAKYASAFYGPFRDAVDSAPDFGDRKTYQMDPANRREALREIAADLEEGADVVMVKPALPYLDIIRDVRNRFDSPIAAYNVSGEYSMVKAAAERGWLDEKAVMLETLGAIKRAGADLILTYWALDFATASGRFH